MIKNNINIVIDEILKIFIFFILFYSNISYSQNLQSSNHRSFTSNLNKVKKPVDEINFSGYYRFLGFVRTQKEVFPNNSGKTTAIISGDYFREPMLLLKIKGKAHRKISFGTDLMINSLYKGPSATQSNLTLDLGLNLNATVNSANGIFKLSSGGVSWYRQSKLTVWGNRSFNRMSIYERRPQTPLNIYPNQRYNKYFENGLVNQGTRYGSRAFQGLFIKGEKLPYNFNLKGVIGKSAFNRSNLEFSDNFTTCFHLKNQIKPNFDLAYNFLSSYANLDTVININRKYSIHTFELVKKWDKLKIHLESGIGNFASPENNLGTGEAIIFELESKQISKLNLDFQFYRITPEFVNVTGNFLNTTVLEVFPNINGVGTTVRPPFKSPMVGLGHPVNNRQGLSLNADADLGKLKINGGIGYFFEIDTSYSAISYRHNVNGQTLSRIYLFAQNWGPYNFLNSTYRGVFEEVSILDTNESGLANFKKYFNTVEFQAKYSDIIFKRKFYIFYLLRFNSCQKDPSYLPQFNTKALVSQLSHDLDFSLKLNNKTVFVATYGIERVIGNQFTDVGDVNNANTLNLFLEMLGISKQENSNLERNQRNSLIGFGIDYKISNNAMIFFRHNRYRYFDPNFTYNHLKGFENMLEIKITF